MRNVTLTETDEVLLSVVNYLIGELQVVSHLLDRNTLTYAEVSLLSSELYRFHDEYIEKLMYSDDINEFLTEFLHFVDDFIVFNVDEWKKYRYSMIKLKTINDIRNNLFFIVLILTNKLNN